MEFHNDELADLPKAWQFDELSDDRKEEVEGIIKPEPGKWYCDTDTSPWVFEVPICPFCGAVAWDTRACDHLVMLYDTEGDSYRRLSVNPEISKYTYDPDEEEILSYEEYFRAKNPGLRTYQTAVCEWSEFVWGFMK